MHEMAIAANILDIVLENAQQYQASRVVCIKLAVGEMAGVSPEALSFCFNSIAKGTVVAEAVLTFEIIPLTGYCRLCEQSFSVNEFRFICPICRSSEVAIATGQELLVEQIEVE